MGRCMKRQVRSFVFKYKWTRVSDLKAGLDVEMHTESWLEQWMVGLVTKRVKKAWNGGSYEDTYFL